jgi:uncharacterized protein
MAKVEVSVNVPVKPTEKVDKVVSAIEKLFPSLTMDMRGDRIEAYGGLESLRNLHKLLWDQMILDTARAVMVEGRVGKIIQFSLNKQAAYVGKVNFPFEEEPLGSIHVQISGGDQVIDWLAPETENGVPIREIEIREDEDV